MGVPLAKQLTGGYSQPDVALDSHLDPLAFDQIPDITPSPFKAFGQAVMLVSFHSGTIKTMPGYEKIKNMPSFVALQTGYTIGSAVELTVDLFTAVGVVMLANADPMQLSKDLESIRSLEKEGLFEFETESSFPIGHQPNTMANKNEVVIVVDPISTGGSVAFEAFMRGYKVVALW